MISAGKLDQRVTVQQATVTKNAIGEDVPAWATLIALWAAVLPPSGQSRLAANQEQHTVDARFIVRDFAGSRAITTGMRVVWKSQNYDIHSILPGTGPHAGTLEIHATNGVRDGR